MKEEEWRFTRTRPIAELDFRPAAAVASVDEAAILSRTFDDSHCYRLVFVNGYPAESLSRVDDLPRGVWIGALSRALTDRANRVSSLLGKHVDLSKMKKWKDED